MHAQIAINTSGYAQLIPSDLQVICGNPYSTTPRHNPSDNRTHVHHSGSTAEFELWYPKDILERISQRFLDELANGGPLLRLLRVAVPQGTCGSAAVGAGNQPLQM